jgi:iron only hydrogenase large subunit-like protein
MDNCPTEAIRIRNGKAYIFESKCVDCGDCYRVCPVAAIHVEHDDFNEIFKYKHRVALIPAVLTGQFPEKDDIEVIFQSLHKLGFTHVFEVEHSVDAIVAQTKAYMKTNADVKPLISSFCPAIVRLIQVKFPSLVDHIIRLKPPIDMSALYIRRRLIDLGAKSNEIGLFYITPCAAKIAAVKSPVGEAVSPVNGVINMDSMFNRINRQMNNDSGTVSDLHREHLTSNGIQWSLTGGEVANFEGRCIAIDGIENAIEFLEKIESEEITGIDFLELRACDQGCPGGILTSGNRFLTVERMHNRAAAFKQRDHYVQREIDSYLSFLNENMHIQPVQPRPMMRLDENMGRAMEMMQRVRKMMCYLPGFDCGCCGSPTCRSLAEDIVKGDANISHCIFMQKMMEKNKKLSPEHSFDIIEQIWGKSRLDKNCYKKGAENEGLAVD